MSKRLRQEAERVKNVKHEVDEEEDKIKLQKERIYAPVVWQRLASGFRIEDLRPNRFEEVIDMIKEFYITEEVLCRNAEIAADDVSTQSFLKQVLFNIRDEKSITVVDEANEDELAGALIMRAIHKADFGRVFSRAMLVEGEAHKKCVKFKNNLNRKVDIFVDFNCDVYIRYYIICVKPNYRRKGLGFQLMRAGLSVASSCGIPVVMGIFTNFSTQKLAKRIGMRAIQEISYAQLRGDDGELMFDDPGSGNYTCAVMAGYVPSPPPLPEFRKEKATDTAEKEPKKTRKEKRALKAKKTT